MKDIVTVYVLRHISIDTVYVGATVRFDERVVSHRWRLNSGTHRNPILQKAWSSVGPEGWTFEEIETCSLNDAVLRENFWIETFRKTHTVANRHAAVAALNYGKRHSQEHKARIAASCKGKKGRVLTSEQSAYILSCRKPMSTENRARVAAQCKARAKPVINLDTGKRYSSAAETAQEMGVHRVSVSEACRGKLARLKGYRWAYANTHQTDT